MRMWPVPRLKISGQEQRSAPECPEERGIKLRLLQLRRGTRFPCSPTAPLQTGPAAVLLGALATKTSLRRKGEGLSICLSAFLNPGQDLCFSRAQPRSSSSRYQSGTGAQVLGDDPSCLWPWVCSDQCCRNTSLVNTSLQENKRSQGSWAVSTDRNVCLSAAG